MFHFHKWSKWQEISRSTISSKDRRDPKQEWYPTGFGVVFERICEKCGKKQFDRQEVKVD